MKHDRDIRYARQISLPEIGEDGQELLAQAKVLVVGAGGLGSPVLMYLAAAGIGTLGVVDHDRVALSNLQRQILYETADIGQLKAEAAADRLSELNPGITCKALTERLDESNVSGLVEEYDLIVDGCDNFETRFLVNQACHSVGRTLVSGAVQRFSGQLYSFKSHLGAPHPCYQCLYPELPPEGTIPRCSEAGILGGVAGVIGSLQATEVVKEILNIGESMSGRMLRYDALTGRVSTSLLPRDPNCVICAA